MKKASSLTPSRERRLWFAGLLVSWLPHGQPEPIMSWRLRGSAVLEKWASLHVQTPVPGPTEGRVVSRPVDKLRLGCVA